MAELQENATGIVEVNQELHWCDNQGDHRTMQYDIHWKNSTRLEAAEVHARRHADVTLDRFAGRIRGVSLKFEDLNGPKGGVDKRCTIEAVGHFVPLIASANATNYFAATNRAIGKLKRAVARSLDRQSF